eukprot:TRINITY_DN4072_c0_g5_i1.p1 TRINITY_DN4072_c0_g5~~TRINITY_DN4072_c0_g5_i1.p1  ORF type:complete len:458 (+),score=155.58 TRINITY_DN4072_c0_g5_i1:125-1498(+)
MPKKIGKYELGKTLGTGTFSKVKLGKDCETGKEYAIKIIDKAQLAKEHMEEQLKREIAVMKLLKHPNIVSLAEVLQTAKHIYLILELVTGGELFDRIVAAKRFDEATARRYFQQMILGVYYCHDQGIAHRDLKPENLLLDSNDTLKISDFGLSNLQRGGAGQGGTLLQTVCGTPNYVAPEVLKDKGYNGITADIWSCGVILFVMLAGYLPFEDPNMNALFNKIERGEYRMARHFSDPVKDLISRILEVSPEKRFTLDQIIAHPWFQIDFDSDMLKMSKGRRLKVGAQEVSQSVSSVQESGDQSPGVGSPKGGPLLDVFALLHQMTLATIHPLTPAAAASQAESSATPRTLQRGMIGRIAVGCGVTTAIAHCDTMLVDLKGNPKHKRDAAQPEIKGFINAPKGLLTYIVTATGTILKDELSLVEVKRGRGDPADFQKLMQDLSGGFQRLGLLRSKLTE